jgi:hypothetical protein
MSRTQQKQSDSDDATGDFYDEHDIDSRRGDADRIERFFYGATL